MRERGAFALPTPFRAVTPLGLVAPAVDDSGAGVAVVRETRLVLNVGQSIGTMYILKVHDYRPTDQSEWVSEETLRARETEPTIDVVDTLDDLLVAPEAVRAEQGGDARIRARDRNAARADVHPVHGAKGGRRVDGVRSVRGDHRPTGPPERT